MRASRRHLAAHLPLAAMLAAVALGCLWMLEAGAPRTFIAFNAGSAVLAAGIGVVRPPRALALAALVLAPALALSAILAGPPIEGVHRWIAIGGVRLHAVMLAGPLFAVAITQRRGAVPALAAALLAALIAWQPDFGTLAALGAAVLAIIAARREPVFVLAACLTLALLLLCWAHPDGLGAVTHVEGVAQALWQARTPLAWAALAALALAVVLPLRHGPAGAAFAAWHAGLVGASLVGPYPTPLVGYGASAILGYGLGWWLLRRSAQTPSG